MLTFEQFRLAYLDSLSDEPSPAHATKPREFDLYGYKPARVLEYLQGEGGNAQTINILRMRAYRQVMSTARCHKVESSKHLWQLTTDGGARFLYFQDGPRTLIFVCASFKVKEKKFQNEIKRAELLREEYLRRKEGNPK